MTNMPTLDQLREQGRVVQLVIAERLGLDPGELTNIWSDLDHDGERIRWQSVRKVPMGFINECLAEAARRIEALDGKSDA